MKKEKAKGKIQKLKDLGVIIDNDIESAIDNEIEKERPFMLLLPYFRNIFHNVIVRGYKSNEILVIDPSSGFSRRLIFHLEKDLEKIKFGRVALVIWK